MTEIILPTNPESWMTPDPKGELAEVLPIGIGAGKRAFYVECARCALAAGHTANTVETPWTREVAQAWADEHNKTEHNVEPFPDGEFTTGEPEPGTDDFGR